MIRKDFKHSIRIVAVITVIFFVVALHGRFGITMLIVTVPIAVGTALLIRLVCKLTKAVGLAITALVTGLAVLLVHQYLGGNVHQQPGRLTGALVIATTLWWYTMFVLDCILQHKNIN